MQDITSLKSKPFQNAMFSAPMLVMKTREGSAGTVHKFSARLSDMNEDRRSLIGPSGFLLLLHVVHVHQHGVRMNRAACLACLVLAPSDCNILADLPRKSTRNFATSEICH